VGSTKTRLALAVLLVASVVGSMAVAVGFSETDSPTRQQGNETVGLEDSAHPTGDTKTTNLDPHRDLLPPEPIAPLGTLRLRPGSHLNFVAFTPDGKRILSHGYWSGINVWDAATGKELSRFMPGASDWVGAALLMPDAESAATLELKEQKHVIRVRDLATLK